MIHKQINLFGEREIISITHNQKPKSGETYEEFIRKFETKKTTDDCFTPKEVYQTVLDWTFETFNLPEETKVVRPFYPNGNYKAFNYKNAIVIDNPPFSIISEIIRFYLENGIKFLLFSPHLTLFGSNQDYTSIVVGAEITYNNGAIVRTSFVTNLSKEFRVMTSCELYEKLEAINKKQKPQLPKYVYPENVLTVSAVQKLIIRGIDFAVKKTEAKHCRGLQSQKSLKKNIFGSGFLISNRAVEEMREKKKIGRKEKQEDQVVQWKLSQKEIDIIKSMNT